MTLTVENVIVGLVVAATVFWAVRALVRSVRRTGVCSSCASSGDCPLNKDPGAPADLLEARSLSPGRDTSS